MSPPAGAHVLLDVRAAGLVYRSGGTWADALDGVDLCLTTAELVGVSGPSGSGKSTLCHLVAGFEKPTSGSAMVLGRPADTVRDWSVVASAPQAHGLIPELTVAENLALPYVRARRSWDGRPELLDRLGLAGLADRLVGETSLGEQQRTAIARALVLDPALLVLDEPTGHQDDEHLALVLAALAGAGARGTAVLVASHDDRVLALADRVVRLEDGRLVA